MLPSLTPRTAFCAQAGFEAARQIEALPAGHPSGRLHGHGFVAKLRASLPANWAAFRGGEVERLRDVLQASAALLDHRLLNDQVPNPTDAHLARWMRDRLDLPGPAELGVQSTSQRGAQLDAAGQVMLWRRYAFQSAHRLPNVPLGHKCGTMHGHGFEAVLHVRTSDARGETSLSYDDLDAIWARSEEHTS